MPVFRHSVLFVVAHLVTLLNLHGGVGEVYCPSLHCIEVELERRPVCVWRAGAPESGARQAVVRGAADDRQAQEAVCGGGDELTGDRDDRRPARDPPPVRPRATSQGARRRDEPPARQPASREPVHERTQGELSH